MELNTDEFLIAETGDGNTAFQLAAWENHVEILKTLWVWAEEKQLNPNELKNKLFLEKDKYGYNAWHRAALGGSLEALETLWNWARDVELNTGKFFLAETGDGYTVFQLATWETHVEVLKKLLVWAEEMQLNPTELKNKLFLTKEQYGFNAWH